MTAQTDIARRIYTATAEWWQMAGVETDDAWNGQWERAATVAGTDIDDPESWVARIRTECVSDVHTLLHRAAENADLYACCDGIGSDVVVVAIPN